MWRSLSVRHGPAKNEGPAPGPWINDMYSHWLNNSWNRMPVLSFLSGMRCGGVVVGPTVEEELIVWRLREEINYWRQT